MALPRIGARLRTRPSRSGWGRSLVRFRLPYLTLPTVVVARLSEMATHAPELRDD